MNRDIKNKVVSHFKVIDYYTDNGTAMIVCSDLNNKGMSLKVACFIDDDY